MDVARVPSNGTLMNSRNLVSQRNPQRHKIQRERSER